MVGWDNILVQTYENYSACSSCSISSVGYENSTQRVTESNHSTTQLPYSILLMKCVMLLYRCNFFHHAIISTTLLQWGRWHLLHGHSRVELARRSLPQKSWMENDSACKAKELLKKTSTHISAMHNRFTWCHRVNKWRNCCRGNIKPHVLNNVMLQIARRAVCPSPVNNFGAIMEAIAVKSSRPVKLSIQNV